MSHYYALAIVPADGDLDELLAATLAPYDENAEIEEVVEDGETYKINPRGMWDWYQVGGRWTGYLAELVTGTEYDPATDPRNVERCWLCAGTGVRLDGLTPPEIGCNGCYDSATKRASGFKPKWPTEWRKRPDLDVVPATVMLGLVRTMDDKSLPFTIFTHDSEHVTTKIQWSRDDYKETELTKDQIRTALAKILRERAAAGLVDRVVVVDYYHS